MVTIFCVFPARLKTTEFSLPSRTPPGAPTRARAHSHTHAGTRTRTQFHSDLAGGIFLTGNSSSLWLGLRGFWLIKYSHWFHFPNMKHLNYNKCGSSLDPGNLQAPPRLQIHHQNLNWSPPSTDLVQGEHLLHCGS